MKRMNATTAIAAFVTVGVFVSGAYIWYIWPKSCELGGSVHGGLLARGCVAYYHGFGFDEGPGILGRNYYRVRLAPRRDEDGLTDVDFAIKGWNKFRGTYPNGAPREEGVCWVSMNYGSEPFPDLHNIRDGKYYDPSGKLGSEVKDGTGIQIYWNCDGVKVWELELKDYKRVSLRRLRIDGFLAGMKNVPARSL